jgi:tRNA A37 threonylcarbamoyladenosine synthetase subunit TsaC/SUA5/YrdC
VTSHPIAQALARGLGRPLLTSSAMTPDEHEPCRDAEEVLSVFDNHLDVVIDANQTPAEPSTVLAVDGEEITLIRQGQGSLDGILDLVTVPDAEVETTAKGRRHSRR